MSKKEDYDKTSDKAIDELHEQLERGEIITKTKSYRQPKIDAK